MISFDLSNIIKALFIIGGIGWMIYRFLRALKKAEPMIGPTKMRLEEEMKKLREGKGRQEEEENNEQGKENEEDDGEEQQGSDKKQVPVSQLQEPKGLEEE